MKRKIDSILYGLIVCCVCLLLVLLGIYVWKHFKSDSADGMAGKNGPDGSQIDASWQPSSPTAASFEKVLSEDWEKLMGQSYRDRRDYCLSIPDSEGADAKSTSKRPLAWYADYAVSAMPTETRVRVLRRLDALHLAGLLDKSAQSIVINGTTQAVTRYSINEQGWKSMGDGNWSQCFIYGSPSLLSVDKFAPVIVDKKAGLEAYQVNIRTGLSKAEDLATWARAPQIQSAFPEIIRSFEGQPQTLMLMRGAGRWTSEQMLRADYPRRMAGPDDGMDAGQRERMEQIQRELGNKADGTPPTEDEIKKLLQLRYATQGDESGRYSNSACLRLPGQGNYRLPVDQTLDNYGNRYEGYSAVVFQGRERDERDKVMSESVPYLEMLVRSGVLTKRMEYIQDRRNNNELSQAAVYLLNPAYAGNVGRGRQDCLSLGAPELRFVDLKLINRDGADGKPVTSFSFKLRLKYSNPPAWMKDAALQANWPDLRNALTQGRACSGKHEFNSAAREIGNGDGACWWAFDYVLAND